MSREEASLAAWRSRTETPQRREWRAATQARRAGLLQAALGLALGGAIGWLWRPLAGLIVAAIAAVLGLLALVAPEAHAATGRVFRRLGRAIAAAVAWVLMAALLWLVFWPLGLLLRARRRLRITLGFDPRLATYWASAAGRRPPADYRRQF